MHLMSSLKLQLWVQIRMIVKKCEILTKDHQKTRVSWVTPLFLLLKYNECLSANVYVYIYIMNIYEVYEYMNIWSIMNAWVQMYIYIYMCIYIYMPRILRLFFFLEIMPLGLISKPLFHCSTIREVHLFNYVPIFGEKDIYQCSLKFWKKK